jgi:hypothetical protein
MRWRRRLIIAAIVLAVISGAGWIWRRFLLPPPPLEISFWYWHQPFQIPQNELDQLKGMGVRRIFVRAGTFHKDAKGLRLTLLQRWASRAEGLALHLVFNFDASVLHDFAETSNETLASAVLPEILAARASAERAGMHVAGIQLDLDCPTSRLPKYADLLHRIRAGMPSSALTLSITALPTWYGSGNLEPVLREIDFAAPQYYEAHVGETLGEYTTVSQPSRTERGLAAAGWRGSPFFAGVPVYGHALVYNGSGKLVGAFHDLGLCEALRNPSFRLARSFGANEEGKPSTPGTYIGEDVYDLEALVDASDGQGKGYHILYDVPTAESLARHMALLRRKRPGNCLGAILFRYPQPGETSTLPLCAVAAVLRGEAVRPALQVALKPKAAPWEMLDTGTTPDRKPVDVSVTVTNKGNTGAFLAPDAVTVTLALENAAVEDLSLRAADGVETFQNPRGEASIEPPALRASPGRSNVLRFRRIFLAAGETQTLATVRLRAGRGARIGGVWSARCPGGFETVKGSVGAVEVMALTPPPALRVPASP